MPATADHNEVSHRIDWLDAAKGLGIALIVIGHVFSTRDPSLFYKYLYAFHVPLFFFVAGVTLQFGKDRFPQLIRKKLRTLLLPYGVYALLGYFFYLAGYALTNAMGSQPDQFRYGLWSPLWGILWGTVGSGNLVNSPLWFLPALFIASALIYAINTQVRPVTTRLIVIALLSGVGGLLAQWIELPFSTLPALIALPFMQAGYLHGAGARWLKWGGGKWIILSIVVLIFLASPLNGFSMQSEALIGNPLLFYLFAFSGIALTTALLQFPLPGRRLLSRLGQHSLSIMVIHMLVIKSAQVILAALLGVGFGDLISDPRWGLLVFAVVSLALVPLVWAMENWIPFTLGKPRRTLTHG